MISDIEVDVLIAAPPRRVWEVLTTEGLVEEWLGCMQYRSEVGHLFYMQPDAAKRESGDISGATHCELLALEPPERMIFSWFFPHTPKTEVEITLVAEEAATRVRLAHRGWGRFDGEMMQNIRDALAGGWSSHVLPGLKRMAEQAG